MSGLGKDVRSGGRLFGEDGVPRLPHIICIIAFSHSHNAFFVVLPQDLGVSSGRA